MDTDDTQYQSHCIEKSTSADVLAMSFAFDVRFCLQVLYGDPEARNYLDGVGVHWCPGTGDALQSASYFIYTLRHTALRG